MLVIMVIIIVVIVIIIRKYGRNGAGRAFHRFQNRIAGQLIPWRCDDSGLVIQFMNDIEILLDSVIIAELGAGQDDAGSRGNLIIEELTEVLVVDRTALGIHDGAAAVDFQAFNAVDNAQDVRQLANTRRLNDDAIRIVLLQNLLQCLLEITLQGAADTAAVDFIDNDAGLLEEPAIDTDLTKLILDKDDFLSLQRFL